MLVAGDAVVVAAIVPGQAGDGQGVHQAPAGVSLRYRESENSNSMREIYLKRSRRSSVMLTNIEWKHGIIGSFLYFSPRLAQSPTLK